MKLSNTTIAMILACAVAILLAATAPQMGLTWDEPAYIAAAESYMGWFGRLAHPAQAFRPEVIEAYWSINHEHPALDKIWSGAVWVVARNFLDDLTAHRLGNILLVALLVALLFLLVAETYGRGAGFFAAAALLALPRFFFHAHLSALDVPAAVSAFAVTFLFWRTLDKKGWQYGVWLGLAWGVALAIKINAVFLPVVFGLWILIFRRRWELILRLAVMGIVALPVFFALWPWLYHDGWARFWEYIGFVTDKHWQIGQWYLGRFYMPPPWHFPFVMLYAVVPLGLLVLALAGGARAGRGKADGGLGWLLVINALIPMVALASGRSMVYDNERLFMATFPFLAALAGAGFGWIASGIGKRFGNGSRPALGLTGLVILLAFAPQLVTSARLYPHLLSYYSEGIGGLPGATWMGLETTYWCESFASALDYINENAKPRDRIWSDPWSHDVLLYYQMTGRLRKDVYVLVPGDYAQSIFGPKAPPTRVGDESVAEWAIFQYRQTLFGEPGMQNPMRLFFQQKEPVLRVEVDGVPIMDLYKK
jgi:4-amino-4-deoxy-L-arabinose transferase-like glycosyltransferase